MVRGRLRAAACMLAAVGMLIAAPRAEAIRPDLSIEQIRETAWRMNEGAPQDVWAMTQTTDGWMWFGGSQGLYRFDGVTFEKVDPQPEAPNRSAGISELVSLDSGGMVIGYHSGGVGIMRDGVVKNYYETDGLDASTTFAIAPGSDGSIWVATRNAVYRFDGARWNLIGKDWDLPAGRAADARFDQRGTLWLAYPGRLYSLEAGTRTFQPGPATNGNGFFLDSPDGRLDYGDDTQLYECPGQHAMAASAVHWSIRSSSAPVDTSGNLWIVGEKGLSRFAIASKFPGWEALNKPAQAWRIVDARGPKSAMADRDGNVWISTIADGVVRLHDSTLMDVRAPQGTEGFSGMAIGDDDVVWMARQFTSLVLSPTDGLYRYDGRYTRAQARDIRTASIVNRGDDGIIRVAGDRDLWRFDGRRFTKAVALPMVSLTHPVIGMANRAGNQAQWITVLGDGLYRRDGATWLRNGGVPGLPDAEASALVFDGDGRLWLGYADDGVISVENGRATRVAFNGTPSLGAIRSISTGRRVIVGGERGLALLEGGKLRALVPDDATAFSLVTGIVQARNGDVWLNTSTGARRISSEALDAAARNPLARVATELFARAEGYPGSGTNTQFFGPSVATSPDGRIWFHGHDGMAWVDPLESDAGHHPIRLAIRHVETGSASVEPHGPLHLAAGTSKITVAYSSLNYAHADAQRFRYRLEGLDDAWTEAGTRREAFFTNLGAGHYRFELLGEDERGDWTPTPIALEFDIAPTFLQSKPFFALCTLAGLLAATLLVRIRVRQLTRRERARMDVRVRERERIARELHDTLLQSMQGVILKVHAVARRKRVDDPERVMLDEAMSSADAAMAEGRDRIQELRTAARSSDELHESLEAAAREMALGKDIAFELLVEGDAVELEADVSDEAWRVAREALSNAFRHAGASLIQATFVYSGDEFQLRVRDDGRGIDEPTLEAGKIPGHWGLPGMRERAGRIGGRLRVTSAPGNGTLVELAVPAAIAYAETSVGGWSRRRRAPLRP